jgi:acyl carrier protein phosphodiesterase
MNHLAHCFLSEPHPESIIGNLLGDFAKGPIHTLPYSQTIIHGIIRHRAIDSFIDSHPVFRTSKQRLPKKLQRFSGIIVDILYDYALIHSWEQWQESSPHAHLSLRDFTHSVNGYLQDFLPNADEHFTDFIHYALEYDILFQYGNKEFLTQVFHGTARRLQQRLQISPPIDLSFTQFSDILPDIEQDFHIFFPEMIEFVKKS